MTLRPALSNGLPLSIAKDALPGTGCALDLCPVGKLYPARQAEWEKRGPLSPECALSAARLSWLCSQDPRLCVAALRQLCPCRGRTEVLLAEIVVISLEGIAVQTTRLSIG